MCSCNTSFPARSTLTHCLCPLAPPAAGCGVARFGCGEGDALGVQVVHQFGGTQTDPRCLETLLELGQDQRLVLEDLSVQFRVRQDEGADLPDAILKAGCCLGGRDAAVSVRVSIGGKVQFWVGPADRVRSGYRHELYLWNLLDSNKNH